MLKILKKIFFKITVFLDIIKNFLIRLIATALIICFIAAIVHNVLKMSEISTNYIGDYKKLIHVDGNKMMNVYDTGSGDKTIVILPGFGSQSPIIQYKTLVTALNTEYRVVVVEYYGYGFSMNHNKERTAENIAKEINVVLNDIGVGRCVLLAHSLSNLYACEYANLYPDNVESIISLDGTYPSEIKNSYLSQKYKEDITNVKLTSIAELTGFARVLSYVKPEIFYIDKMMLNGVYTKADMKIYRNRIGSSYLTRPMVNEMKSLEKNMNDLVDYKYPDYMPVLQIMSKETVKEYDSFKSETKKSLKDFANNMISNPTIQTSVEIDGDHMLQITATQKTVEVIKNFLISY